MSESQLDIGVQCVQIGEYLLERVSAGACQVEQIRFVLVIGVEEFLGDECAYLCAEIVLVYGLDFAQVSIVHLTHVFEQVEGIIGLIFGRGGRGGGRMWVRILEIGEYGFVEDCFRGVDHGCLFNAMLDVHVEDVEAADEQVVRIDQVVAYMRKFVYFFF